MTSIASGHDVELRRAEKLVAKDKKQRWVCRGPNGWAISETPIPHKDKTSVYWMPLVGRKGCVGFSFAPAILAHDAMNGVNNP